MLMFTSSQPKIGRKNGNKKYRHTHYTTPLEKMLFSAIKPAAYSISIQEIIPNYNHCNATPDPHYNPTMYRQSCKKKVRCKKEHDKRTYDPI
jgi:hypothetical protein